MSVFTTTMVVNFPKGKEGKRALHWLNVQYTGKPTMPLEEKCAEDHVEATHNLFCSRVVRLTIEIDKQGNWKLLESVLV